MEDNVFGITPDTLELEEPDLKSMFADIIGERKDEVAKLVSPTKQNKDFAQLSIFSKGLKATALILGPREFLATFILDYLPGTAEFTCEEAVLLYVTLMHKYFDLPMEEAIMIVANRLITGIYKSTKGMLALSGSEELNDLELGPTFYAQFNYLDISLTAMLHMGEAMEEAGVFESLGIPITDQGEGLPLLRED